MPHDAVCKGLARFSVCGMIGTVGSGAKMTVAQGKGYDHVILYREQDFVTETARLTANSGVALAIDGIGGATLRKTLDIVKPFGVLANVGQAAGEPDVLSLSDVSVTRSIAFSRPSVLVFMSDLRRYQEGAAATMEQLRTGLRVDISETLPLSEAAQAHRLLETGQTTGALILVP